MQNSSCPLHGWVLEGSGTSTFVTIGSVVVTPVVGEASPLLSTAKTVSIGYTAAAASHQMIGLSIYSVVLGFGLFEYLLSERIATSQV